MAVVAFSAPLCYYSFVSDNHEDREWRQMFGTMGTSPPESLMIGGITVSKSQARPSRPQQAIYWDILNGSVGGRYNLISAIHKEIRRCDTERGMALGHLFGRVYGFPRLKAYIKGVILEESRDKSLIEFLGQRLDPEGVMVALQWFIETKKKWHLPTRHAVYKLGYTKDMIKNAEPIKNDVASSMLRSALKDGDAVLGYTALWGRVMASVTEDIDGVACFSSVLSEVFPDDPSLRGFHGVQAAIELSVHPETWEIGSRGSAPQLAYTEPAEYPEFKRYVFDRHTSTGMKLIKSTLPALLEVRGSSQVVDLRWSGVTMGCVWREVAGQKFTPEEMRTLDWDGADIPVPLWEMAVSLDRRTEPKIFGPWRGE